MSWPLSEEMRLTVLVVGAYLLALAVFFLFLVIALWEPKE